MARHRAGRDAEAGPGPADSHTQTCVTDPDPGAPTHSARDPPSARTGPADTQCHWTLWVAHALARRPEHLPPSWRLRRSGARRRGGERGRGLRVGSGAGWGWGLCSARAVRVRGRQPYRTGSAAAAASAVSYARARGGDRHRPIRGASALTNGPRPRLRYCSCSARPQPPARENVAGGGSRRSPAMKNLETLTMWGRFRGGATAGGRAPEFPSVRAVREGEG